MGFTTDPPRDDGATMPSQLVTADKWKLVEKSSRNQMLYQASKSIDDKEAHPEGKPCIFLCWQCGEPRDNKTAHPDGKWCDSSSDPKNDQAPAPRAGPGKE